MRNAALKNKMADKNPHTQKDFIPPGLTTKPLNMPPGQYKKGADNIYTELAQPSQQLYIDPSGVVRAHRYSMDAQLLQEGDPKVQAKSNRSYMRNAALTSKTLHPAKIPHPLWTHFMNKW